MLKQHRQQIATFKTEINALACREILNQLFEDFDFENILLFEQFIRELNISMISVSKS